MISLPRARATVLSSPVPGLIFAAWPSSRHELGHVTTDSIGVLPLPIEEAAAQEGLHDSVSRADRKAGAVSDLGQGKGRFASEAVQNGQRAFD